MVQTAEPNEQLYAISEAGKDNYKQCCDIL